MNGHGFSRKTIRWSIKKHEMEHFADHTNFFPVETRAKNFFPE